MLLADQWGPPSGVVALVWIPALAGEGAIAQVELLLVDPAQRRQGLGRMLLKAGAQAARAAGCASLRLVAPDAAEPSLAAFCRTSGFVEGGRLHLRALRKRP